MGVARTLYYDAQVAVAARDSRDIDDLDVG
jgi:hypothetical protein